MRAQIYSVLTIAGSDSSGGAGIQADLKTVAAHGCYAASAITALTAQNTTGVQAVHPSPPGFIEQQIYSVLDDVAIDAIKTGMLYDTENARAVARALDTHYKGSVLPPFVCDPVCVSTSGHSLLDPPAIQVLSEDLFPLARVITPNKPEAELLLSHAGLPLRISTLEEMVIAAKSLLVFRSSAVLVKGGHLQVTIEEVDRISSRTPDVTIIRHGLFDENMEVLQVGEQTTQLVVDVLQQDDGNTTLFVRPRIESTSTHGTGCTLSTAIACELARGNTLVEAIKSATAYTHLGIETAHGIGKGHGPLNHLHSLASVLIPKPTKSNRYPFTRLLIQRTAHLWKEYVEHDFVKLLGKGTLPKEQFLVFIKQDYHYLKYYARAYGLMAAKSTSFTSIESSAQTILHIIREITTHKTFCKSFGITIEELESTQELPATTSYGAYLIDIGLQGDTTKLLMALLSCLVGYGEVGLWLKKNAAMPNSWVKLEGNPYKKWIDDYSGEEYQSAVKLGLDTIETRAVVDPPSRARFEEWCSVWERCTRLEKGFWDMAMVV